MDCDNRPCDKMTMVRVKKKPRPLGRTYISERRAEAGMTQEEFVEKIDVSRSMLSKIETGSAQYTQRTLETIAEVLGCTPAELLTPPTKPTRLADESQVKAMLRTIEGLPEDAVNPLWRMIKGFIEDAASPGQSDRRDRFEPAIPHHEELP